MHGLVKGKWQLVPCSTWRLCFNKSFGEQRSLLLFSVVENETISYSQIWAFSIYLFLRYLQYMRHAKQHLLYCALCPMHTQRDRIMSSFHISDIIMHFNAFCVFFVCFCAVLLVSLCHFLSLSMELKNLLKCYYNHSGSRVDWWSIER